MYQIRISSEKNKGVYRVVQVQSSMTLFDFNTVVTTAFMLTENIEVIFQSIRLDGKKVNKMIPLSRNDFFEFESIKETVKDWFIKVDDKMDYIRDDGIKMTVTLVNVTKNDNLEDGIIEGEGNLISKIKEVDIDKLNELIQIDLNLDEDLFELEREMFSEFLHPDFPKLFLLADELKKLKPWNYFDNGDIIAVQLTEEKYFITVMGAGGQEYGLMMYDEDFGYQSLEKIINGEPLSSDFAINLSALSVNYVDRDELEKEDYELIKENGFTFRGKKNWMTFRAFEAGFVPMQPDYTQVEDMIDLIKIMIEVTKLRMSGWEYPPVPANSYPLFEGQSSEEVKMLGILQMEPIEIGIIEMELNDLEIAKIKKKPKTLLEMEFDYFYVQTIVASDDGRPMYPLLNVSLDCSTGEVIYFEVFPFPKHPFIQQQLFLEMLRELPELPSKIFVTEETKRYLKPVADLFGMDLVVSELPNVAEFKEMVKHNPIF